MASPRRPRQETARLGKALYERDIRRHVETDHHGEIVAIDVDSGSWVVADGEVIAVDRLREVRQGPSMSCASGWGTGRCAALERGPCGGRSDPGRGERRL